MKHLDEYRDGHLAKGFAARIAQEARADRAYAFMEFCGGHTHAISRYGVEDILPENIRLIHGPGCPVCVLPIGRIDEAIALAENPIVTLCVYGDLMRVPGSHGASLTKAKAGGADIRMVYSTLEAIEIAGREPAREVVFFAIGFETTTPPTVAAIRLAQKKGFKNFSVFCNHVLTPAAMRQILEMSDPEALPPDHAAFERNRSNAENVIDFKEVERASSEKPVPTFSQRALEGFIGPAHVSTVIGTAPYEVFAQEFRKPVVIAGFEPLDVLQAILMLVRQVNDGRAEVENEYIRAVTRDGNRIAQQEMAEVFELRESFEWRGLGEIPKSALRLREAYGEYDAERRFPMERRFARDNPACECGAILRGVKQPRDCKLFGSACTPETPIGACMVSSEGSCAAYWAYGRFRASERKAAE